ncbi:glycosyltransferase [Rhodovastum atsumiense]|uniref:Glycosyltransferase n=1 Tax=Rhodovastum atsumiense TaxID=504468 RepID=A0A5M6IUH8_9PROT|nr:glycosyltransferase [Rhodovastum atsumiense]
MKITVGIPSIGRASILRETLQQIGGQTRRPDEVVICGTKPADVAGCEAVLPGTRILFSTPGLPCQRNAILSAAKGTDVVVFFDDDFIPHPGYLAAIERHMLRNPRIVLATGRVVADGIGSAGLSAAEAGRILAADPPADDEASPVFSAYGCNMAVRLRPIEEANLRFDERLPLYAWQEDVDMSRRLAPLGEIVKIAAATGVHRGVTSGRVRGVRLGYSQVANPLYLSRKREGYPFRRAVAHIARNLTMNILRATWPEPHIDRRGRLRGNLLAFQDLLTNRMFPGRILDL